MRQLLASALLATLVAAAPAAAATAASQQANTATATATSSLYNKFYRCQYIVVGDPFHAPAGQPTIALKYREWFRPDASAVLVQLSGMQSHSQWFNENGDYLHSLGYNVYALDRRGSGFSHGMRGHVYSPFQWIADLAQVIGFIRAKNPGKPLHLMANSFGARIAMTFAEAYPTAIQSLILDAPATHMLVSLPAATMVDVQFKVWDYFPTPLRDDLFTADPEKLTFINNDAAGLRQITANTYKMGELINTGNLQLPSLRRLTMPVLVLTSLEDPMVDAPAMISGLYDRLETRKKLVTYHEPKHYLLFSPASVSVLQEIATWIAAPPPATLSARRSIAPASDANADTWIPSVQEALADAGIDPLARR